MFCAAQERSGAANDTPEYVQQFMIAQHREWLEAAGAKVGEGVVVEIDPAWAVDAEQVARRVKAGTTFTETTYLCE